MREIYYVSLHFHCLSIFRYLPFHLSFSVPLRVSLIYLHVLILFICSPVCVFNWVYIPSHFDYFASLHCIVILRCFDLMNILNTKCDWTEPIYPCCYTMLYIYWFGIRDNNCKTVMSCYTDIVLYEIVMMTLWGVYLLSFPACKQNLSSCQRAPEEYPGSSLPIPM